MKQKTPVMTFDLEELNEKWHLEQLKVACEVEKLPDSDAWSDPSVVNYISERFKTVKISARGQQDDANIRKVHYGGVDVSFPTADDKQRMSHGSQQDEYSHSSSSGTKKEQKPSVAVYVILEYPGGDVVYKDYEFFTLQVPYIPSYLAFREIDPLERLIQKQLRERPELTPKAILVDGNGIFHVRRAGIACFVGVRTGIPTIGVSKSLYYEGDLNKDVVFRHLEQSLHAANRVIAKFTSDPESKSTPENNVVIFDQESIPRPNDTSSSGVGNQVKMNRGDLVNAISPYCRGFAVPLAGNVGGEVLACALVGHGGQFENNAASSKPYRTRTKNPIYVSIGHKVSLQESVCICAALSFAKIPEPVRQADLIGREMQRTIN